MVCIFILSTNLSIYVCVSDRVHLGSGSTSNLFIFLFFKLKESEKVLSHRYVLAKLKYI